MPRKANRWADDFAAPRKSSPAPPNASEYHLIDLTTGLSHGGFASLAGARQCAREKDLPAWDIFQWQCLGQVPPSAVEQSRCLRPAEVVDSPRPACHLQPTGRWWGQQMTSKYTSDIFFRHGRWQPTARITQRPHGRYAGRPAPAQAAQVLTSQMFYWTDPNSSAMLFNSEPFPQGYIFEQGQAPNGNASNQTARSRGTCPKDGAGSALAEQATRGRPILAPSG